MKLNEKERKLLVLALDRGAHSGEADNAAAALLRSLRARFGDAYKLLEELEGVPVSPSVTAVQVRGRLRHDRSDISASTKAGSCAGYLPITYSGSPEPTQTSTPS